MRPVLDVHADEVCALYFLRRHLERLQSRIAVVQLDRVAVRVREGRAVADTRVESVHRELDVLRFRALPAPRATSETPSASPPPNVESASVRLPVSYSTQRSPEVFGLRASPSVSP